MRRALFALLLLPLASCVLPPNNSQRLTESALDMNTAARFGRMDVALEHVGSKARSDFMRRHADWGTRLRVVDVEFGGFELVKSDEAEVYLDVLWLRMDEATVRTTRIVQRWRDERGHWELIEESRKEGEEGLLGEPPPEDKTPEEGASAAGASQQPALGLHTRVIQGD